MSFTRFTTSLLFLCMLPGPIVLAQSSATPELPRVYLDTTYRTGTGSTVSVPAGGNFQAALDAAAPGDTIVLQAGATYTGTFELPVKSGSSYITIRTSTPDSSLPAPGTRVSPANAPLMARVVTPNTLP